ncbi:MAG: hypothetical protein LBR81_06205 [Prevotellaceae bacterium]|jgi:hypothetical protein|nr:hypothetical protein [Prevotellaceae bacterium]
MKTKLINTFVLILICTVGLQAQDIITLKNGSEINAVVSEITADAVKYKKFENQQGPMYTVLKTEVFMVKYQNGDKDVFSDETSKTKEAETRSETNILWEKNNRYYLNDRQIDGKEFLSVLETDPEAMARYKKGATLTITGGLIATAGLAGIVVCNINGLDNKDAQGKPVLNGPLMASSCVGIIGGAIILYVGLNQASKAIDIYNSNQRSKNSVGYHLKAGITDSGIGLSLTFK